MASQMIVRIGYDDYTMTMRDAIALHDIAERMTRVKQQGYIGPYYPVVDAEPLIQLVHVDEVDRIAPIGEPDAVTQLAPVAGDIEPF